MREQKSQEIKEDVGQKGQEIKDDVGLQFQEISTGTEAGQAMVQQRNTNKGGQIRLTWQRGYEEERGYERTGFKGRRDSGDECGWESLAMAPREQEGWPGKYK